MQGFEVMLKSGKSVRVDDVDAYQPEGPMTTFFTVGSSRQVIDSWATRVASYRTADIVAIQRCSQPVPRSLVAIDVVELPELARYDTERDHNERYNEHYALA